MTSNKILHIHLDQCQSTQIELATKLDQSKSPKELQNILISTNRQVAGVGRKSNPWFQLEHSLAFSFTLSPNPTPTLTTVEVSLLVIKLLMAIILGGYYVQ